MRHLPAALVTLILGVHPVFADAFYTTAPVVGAVIHPSGAELTLRTTLNLPAGEHMVIAPVPEGLYVTAIPRVRLSAGVDVLGYYRWEEQNLDAGLFWSEDQRAEVARVEALEADLHTAEDRLARDQAELIALQAQRAYLERTEPPAGAGADEVLALGAALQQNLETVISRTAALDSRLRPAREALEALRSELKAAQAALARKLPVGMVTSTVGLRLVLKQAQEVTIETRLIQQGLAWAADYEIDLDRRAGTVSVGRNVVVVNHSDLPLDRVALSLSTAPLSERHAPTPTYPRPASIYEPAPLRLDAPGMMMETEAMPVMEPEIVVEEAPMIGAPQSDGLALTYELPFPVSIAPGDGAEFTLDRLELTGESLLHANPRDDESAYLVAEVTNDTGEPLLPGQASFARDGVIVGKGELGLVPAGAQTLLGFGPVEGVRLGFIRARNETGGAGFVSRSNTRTQRLILTVENFTGESQTVRAFYPLPYSEQEDLSIGIDASPPPDEKDIDHKRGVSAWDMELAPGEKREIHIDVRMDWPEGMDLNWYP